MDWILRYIKTYLFNRYSKLVPVILGGVRTTCWHNVVYKFVFSKTFLNLEGITFCSVNE